MNRTRRATGSVARMGEFGLIEKIRRWTGRPPGRGLVMGIGDDAAVFQTSRGGYGLLTTDMLVEGVHFDMRYSSMRDIGHKAMAVNLSDIAAMGGRPLAAVVGLGIPPDRADLRGIREFHAGLSSAARRFGCVLAGGDTVASPRGWTVYVAVFGESRRPVYRSGARVGDDIWTTGTAGDAAAGLEILETAEKTKNRKNKSSSAKSPAKNIAQCGAGAAIAGPYGWLCKRLLRPQPRVREGLTLSKRGWASAMIDNSDGLVSCVSFICRESGTGAVVEPLSIPVSAALRGYSAGKALRFALFGGEDYELVFTAPEKFRRAVAKSIDASLVGKIVPRSRGVRMRNPYGRLIPLPNPYKKYGAASACSTRKYTHGYDQFLS